MRDQLTMELPRKLRNMVGQARFGRHGSPLDAGKNAHFAQYGLGARTEKRFGERNNSNDMSAFAYTSAMDFCIPEKFQDEEEQDENDGDSSQQKSKYLQFGQGSQNIDSIQHLGMAQLDTNPTHRALTSMNEIAYRSPDEHVRGAHHDSALGLRHKAASPRMAAEKGALKVSPLPAQHTMIGFAERPKPIITANKLDEGMMHAAGGNSQVPQSPTSLGKKSYKNIMLDKLPQSTRVSGQFESQNPHLKTSDAGSSAL